MLTTDDIIDVSLNLVSMDTLPFDSKVYVPGENIQKILMESILVQQSYFMLNNVNSTVLLHITL